MSLTPYIESQVGYTNYVEIKTPSRLASTNDSTTQFFNPAKRNVLSAYRSYTYKFTLAALKNQELIDPSQYIENKDYFIIAKSGGKGSAGLDIDLATTPDNEIDPITNSVIQSTKQRFAEFNENSPGAFDHYITRVQINNIIGGNERANMSIETKIEIDLFESLSMAGFIEALHITALACGAPNYTQCKYVLKMEFIGYPDGFENSLPEIIPNSTRFFVFGFTGIEIDVTEEGTIYRCTAVPHNDLGFGNPSILTTDIEAQGTTVGDILKSFAENLNNSSRAAAEQEIPNQDRSFYDEYEIVFPSSTEQGIDESFRNNSDYQRNEIYQSKVIELFRSNAVYRFPDPADGIDESGASLRLSIVDSVVPFKKGSSILDCIAAVIRDSEYAIQIVNDVANGIDSTGMVDYFMVHLESEIKGYNETANRYVYRFRFIVTKFKIHYGRIYPRPIETIDMKPIRDNAHRSYEYFYTGANTDIRRFYLKFNTLFFQAIPHNMGNNPNRTASSDAGQPSNTDDRVLTRSRSSSDSSPIGRPPVRSTAEASGPYPDGDQNAVNPHTETYTQFSRRMHKAILENVDQITGELEIIGDPYYLVTNGLGIQRFKLNQDGTTGLNEAPIYTNDVMIYIKFINPYDIDQNTGLIKFKNPVAAWSGIFRVLEVQNRFQDGAFNQTLSLIRLNSQVEDTGEEPRPLENFFEFRPNPNNQTVEAPTIVPSSARANSRQLAAEIASGLPVGGLSGSLDNLIPGSEFINESVGSIVSPQLQSVSGSINSLGSIINQLTASKQQALSKVSSAIRLSNAGLTALSPSVNQVGGVVDQISRTVKSIGFSNVDNQNVASTLNLALNQPSTQLSIAEINKVGSLGNRASGLVSEVSSRIDSQLGESSAVSSNLGIDVSALSGISNNLTSKLPQQIKKAATSIPENVDLTAAVDRGLILDNIPFSSLPNIPATHPRARAPQSRLSNADIRSLQQQVNPALQLPSLSSSRGQLPVSEFDAANVAGKLAVVNQSAFSVLGKIPSVESSVNIVQTRIPSGVPNTSDIKTSVINRYSAESAQSSPLLNLIKNGNNI
jgi:hypothetical protein